MNGLRAVAPNFIERLERELHVSLPESFKFVSRFFDGSGIFIFLLHHVGLDSPTNVVSETKHLRATVNSPGNLIVLGEPAESLIVMDCNSEAGQVLWCDAIDVKRLGKEALMTAPEASPDVQALVDAANSPVEVGKLNIARACGTWSSQAMRRCLRQ